MNMNLYDLLTNLFEKYVAYAQKRKIDPRQYIAEVIQFAAHRSAAGYIDITKQYRLTDLEIDIIAELLGACFEKGVRKQLTEIKKMIH